MSNIYYDPEKFGLKVIRDRDAAGSYEFDQVVLFKDSRGRFLMAHDSGCSCPLPFNSQGVNDLTEVKTLADVADYARSKWADRTYDDDSKAEVERHVASLVDGLALS